MKELLDLILKLLTKGDTKVEPEVCIAPEAEFGTIKPIPEVQKGFPNQSQLDSLKSVLSKRESGNNPKIINSIGFVGLFQFGAAALEDLGYLKVGAWKAKKNSALKDPSLFTGINSINNLEDFLNSPDIQNKCMDSMLKINFNRLVRLKVDVENMEVSDVCGLLAVAHLLGAGGARDYFNGKDGQDAYGTKSSEYFNLGKKAIM